MRNDLGQKTRAETHSPGQLFERSAAGQVAKWPRPQQMTLL